MQGRGWPSGAPRPQVKGRQDQVQAMKAEQQARELETEVTSASAGKRPTQETGNFPLRPEPEPGALKLS